MKQFKVIYVLGLTLVAGLFLGGCPSTVSVPDLAGLNEGEAASAVAQVGLVLGAVTTAHDDFVPAGEVISQNPIANTLVSPDSAVDIVISLGPTSGEGEGEGEGGTSTDLALVASGSFEMGRPYTGTGSTNELPVHSVQLNSYYIGTYETTHAEYVAVLNYAYQHGYLDNQSGGAYDGGSIYVNGKLLAYTSASSSSSQIVFDGGVFSVRSIQGTGGIPYSMAMHPVVLVTWYGAVAYCNWLSEIDGLDAAYDLGTWSLRTPSRVGYRLPTEAEWERAAAWDGAQHRRYGVDSDTITTARANYYDAGLDNPLGLVEYPTTSPVGWYNGINVSPRTGVLTIDSPSPVGCYDMSGNVWEWCQDWFAEDYYASGPTDNPTGPSTGAYRVQRGGAWNTFEDLTRSAYRLSNSLPDSANYASGFRVARNP